MFADFQIGVDLARNDLMAAEAAIHGLRRMPDDNGKSDIRMAQLLMKRQNYKHAKELLTHLLGGDGADNIRVRSIRAVCAARDTSIILKIEAPLAAADVRKPDRSE